MGYGEFGGNGSVICARCVGKDREPRRGTGGRFIVQVNGQIVANVDLDTSRILIVWGRTRFEDIPDGTRNVPMAEPAPAD
jgi:hypothetical protein